MTAAASAPPGVLSYVCVRKFEDYLPLYRIEKIFSRIGVDLPRASLSNWVIQCADMLKPLYKLLHARLGEYDIASAVETSVQVLHAPSRAHTVAYEFLHEFNGYLHFDGYSGYKALTKK